MDKTSETELPKLPAGLQMKSQFMATVFIAYSLAMYVVPAVGAYLIYVQRIALWEKVIIIAPLILISQQGLHLLGWVGHEGFHFNLHESRKVSAVLAILFSSLVGSFLQIGAAISHWNHHRFTNVEGDPDIPLFTKYRNLFSRMLFARMNANRQYIRNAIRIATGKPVDYASKMPFSDRDSIFLARLNLVASVAVICGYAAIFIWNPAAGLISILLPHLAGILYSGLRSYFEHAGTSVGTFKDSRTRLSPFFSIFYFFNNYHLEHHLYPNIPCYQLPKVHKYLTETGVYQSAGAVIDKGIVRNYSFATGKYQYPDLAMTIKNK